MPTSPEKDAVPSNADHAGPHNESPPMSDPVAEVGTQQVDQRPEEVAGDGQQLRRDAGSTSVASSLSFMLSSMPESGDDAFVTAELTAKLTDLERPVVVVTSLGASEACVAVFPSLEAPLPRLGNWGACLRSFNLF